MLLPINKFIFSILLTLFTSITSLGCALCQMDIPVVSVTTKVSILPNKSHFEIQWKFDKKFISSLTQYDLDSNGIFDKDEQDSIRKSLEDYLNNFNYLTYITYSQKHFISKKPLKIQVSSKTILFENGFMYYSFNFDADFIPQYNHILRISFLDKQNNFNFKLQDIILEKYQGKYLIKPFEHYATIEFNDPIKVTKTISDKNITTLEPTTQAGLFQELSQQLKLYKGKIQTLLNDIKQTNSVTSYLWLLFFSFVYGILHAIGPGHGKSLVASYFLSENRSMLKAINISILIGFVHTFSAFLLTIFVYFILNLLFLSFLTDVEYVATKLSAIIIILIALYLIYKKYKTTTKLLFSIHNPNTSNCSCNSCNTKSEDLGVILAAGIVPCPGTVTIFIFSFGLGIYYIGFLSALFMSLGMSLIIFITAYLSSNVRKKSSSNTTLKKIFEYGSLVFILCLGFFLLFI